MPRTQLFVKGHTQGGKPSEYIPEFHDEQGFQMALSGKTASQMAERFNIKPRTIKRWFNDHPSFKHSVNLGRDEADEKVTISLYNRALGFTQTTAKNYVVPQGKGVSEVETHNEQTYFPPDVGAALNWLKNRKPDVWRERKEAETPANIVITLNLDGETVKAIDAAKEEELFSDFQILPEEETEL